MEPKIYVDKKGRLTRDGLGVYLVISQYNCRRTVEETASWFGIDNPSDIDAILKAGQQSHD